jgi:hypothetical protein
MTSSLSKVSALFNVILQLCVQNGKGGRKEGIKSSEIFFEFFQYIYCIMILSVWFEPQKFTYMYLFITGYD